MSSNEAVFLRGAMHKILYSMMTFVPNNMKQKQAVAFLFICFHPPNVLLMYSQYKVYLIFQRAFDSNSNDDKDMFVNSEFVLSLSFYDEVFDPL